MPRINTHIFAALLMALSGAHLVQAQTSAVAHLAVQSGNGQVACSCLASTLQQFQPIVVKATDANGNPVAGATIAWTSTATQGTSSGQMAVSNIDHLTSITGGDGLASTTFNLGLFNNFSSPSVPYLVTNLQAAVANTTANTVTFTETQSLISEQGGAVIQANSPTVGGNSLTDTAITANVGDQFKFPFLETVAGTGVASNGVANVSVRLLNLQSSPVLTCLDNGGYADPGSVLTDPHGNASCTAKFSGSGTGKFYVLVGGIAGKDLASSLYLQAYGPYSFTSNPGAPTAMQIVSGNNQVNNVGVPLNPLVAKLVDAGGNAVQNKVVVWTVVPAAAVALTDNLTTTDNSGLVSTTATLFQLAGTGATITVALQSDPTISAVFQETIIGSVTALVKQTGGDGQSAQINTNFSSPLVVRVSGAAGAVKNYPVQFFVSGPVSLLGSSTVSTDANGFASISVKAGATAGAASVTAVAGVMNQSFSLTVTTASTVAPPTGIAIVGTGTQSAIINSKFADLVVRVTNAAGPINGYVVSFSSTGPVVLGSAAATTGTDGQAQISVTAGSTTGIATVTASVPGFSQTFTLTVLPIGPAITSSSFLNAASRQVGSLSPCSLAIVTASGLAPDGISALAGPPLYGRWPLSSHNLSILVGGVSAPIRSVAMGDTYPEVTFQVPCEVTPGSAIPVVVNVGAGSTSLSLTVQAVSPGILETVMSDGSKRAVVVRDDGSFTDVGTAYPNPARRGENVRIYVTGLGPTVPAVGTNSVQNPNADLLGRDAQVAGQLQVGLSGVGGVQVVSARQAPDLIGVYEVQFVLPSNAQTGNDIAISVGIIPVGGSGLTQSLNSKIAIQ